MVKIGTMGGGYGKPGEVQRTPGKEIQTPDTSGFGSESFGRCSVSVDRRLAYLRLTVTEFGFAVRSENFGRWLGRETSWISSTY